jgi:hypothetical protein
LRENFGALGRELSPETLQRLQAVGGANGV